MASFTNTAWAATVRQPVWTSRIRYRSVIDSNSSRVPAKAFMSM
jgi:hypothetical protein